MAKLRDGIIGTASMFLFFVSIALGWPMVILAVIVLSWAAIQAVKELRKY